jgi:hypothetical protein
MVSSGHEGYLVLVTWAVYAGDINQAFAFKMDPIDRKC